MKKTILVLLMLCSIISYGQIDARIKQIQKLYTDYNEDLSNMDNYSIKLSTGGSYPSLTIYTDFNDKVMIKTHDADEFSSGSTEYYYLKDTIQFIFSKSDRLLTHWGADTVRYEIQELRFYFEDGKVIKTLKKSFKGVEGQNNRSILNSIPNKAIDYKKNFDSNWSYYEKKITDLMKLYIDLKRVF